VKRISECLFFRKITLREESLELMSQLFVNIIPPLRGKSVYRFGDGRYRFGGVRRQKRLMWQISRHFQVAPLSPEKSIGVRTRRIQKFSSELHLFTVN
jgi:hypothetical protein